MTYDKCVYKMLSFYVKLHILFVTILSTLPNTVPRYPRLTCMIESENCALLQCHRQGLQALLVLLTQHDVVD